MYDCTTGDYNVGIGYNALYELTTTDNNTAVGYHAGRYIDGGSANETPANSVFLGYNSRAEGAGESNQIVLGDSAVGNGANTVTLGNTSISELHCQVDITVDSDARIKKNVTPVSNLGLDFVNSLNPVTFNRVNPADYPEEIRPREYEDQETFTKDENGNEVPMTIKARPKEEDDPKTYVGLIAQEVEQTLTDLGIEVEIVKTNKRGKKSITYGNLVAPLIKAVQELSKELNELKTKIN
jgi:hypothetical protein